MPHGTHPHGTQPHAWNYYMSPLGTRPLWERRPVADYGRAFPGLAGQVPGVTDRDVLEVPHGHGRAYVEAGQGGSTVAVSVPAAYLWDGTGAVPPELADLAETIAGIFGGSLPPRSNAAGYAEGLRSLYAALQECGTSYATITQAIAAHAPDTQAIAYAIQLDLLSRPVCAAVVKHPIAAPVAPSAPPASLTPGAVTAAVTAGSTTPTAKPIPWGWIAGGVGLLAVIGGAVYFATRKKRRRNPRRGNPCGSSCDNPSDGWIETTGYEVTEGEPLRLGTRKNPGRGAGRGRSRKRSKRNPRENMAESTRGHLASSEFAIPERRAYPIQSEAQAVKALSFAEWPRNKKDRARVRKAVFSRYPYLHRDPPYRFNEYGGSGGFPSIQPDVMALQAPVLLPMLGNPRGPRLAHLDFATPAGYRWFRQHAADRPDLYGHDTGAGWALPSKAGRFEEALQAAGGRLEVIEPPPKRKRGNPLGLAPGETGPRVVYLADGGPIVGWEVWSTRPDGSGKAYHGSYRTVREAQGWALAHLNVARFETSARLTGTGLREGGGRKRRNPKGRTRPRAGRPKP